MRLRVPSHVESVVSVPSVSDAPSPPDTVLPAPVEGSGRLLSHAGLEWTSFLDLAPERAAAEKSGRKTVTYVSNIYNCYVSYLLVQGEYIQRRDLKKKSAPGGVPH